MQIGRLVKQWLLPVVLAVVALVSWQAAERADFDPIDGRAETYELSLQTPMLSARRVPRTLRAPVSDDLIGPEVDRLVEQTPDQQVCLMVRNGDRQLGDHREVNGGLVPASNQKLLTTFGALGILGPDFTFTTRVMTPVAPIDGVVEGDIYLVGDGDPFLITDNWLSQYQETDGRSHTRLESLADAVAAVGVTQVTGSVLGDESLYDDQRYGPWDSRLVTQKQSGPMSALTVNEGFVDWPEVFRESFRPRSETDNPPIHAASVLAGLLAERGITIDGGTGVGITPEPAVELASVQSPPLAETVTHINSYSSNIGAELLLKRLGLAVADEGSTEAGADVLAAYLAEQGIPMDDVQIFDGSGLAETNRLTCDALASILVETGPDSPLGASLSVAGARGSLANRFVDSPAEGLVLAKTGTLRGVRALSGFVRSGDPAAEGGYVTFSHIVNDDDVIADELIRSIQVPFVVALSRYPAGPPIEQLSPLAPIPA